MRITLTLLVLVLTASATDAQNSKLSGKIIDSENNEELPYANIMVKDHLIGTSSDLSGVFELELPDSLKNDSIIISYVGYAPLVLCMKSFENGLVKLVPRDIRINEVVIKPSTKEIKPLIINPFKRTNCGVRYSPVNDKSDHSIPCRPQEPAIEALYFPNKAEYDHNQSLKEVRLQVSNYKTPPTYFNLRIFKATDDLMPAEDLLNKSLTIKVTEKDEFIIADLREYNLSMPVNGLFIGFELLIIDQNKSTIHTENGSTITLFSPYLNFTSSEEEEHFWLYSKGKWIKTFQKHHDWVKKDVMLYYIPAISLVLN